MRVTIGKVDAWSIAGAQDEARRLQVQIDQGDDPRQVKADIAAAKDTEQAAQKAQEARETVIVSKAWGEYVTAMKPAWGALHLQDHAIAMQAGGEQRKRSPKLTSRVHWQRLHPFDWPT